MQSSNLEKSKTFSWIRFFGLILVCCDIFCFIYTCLFQVHVWDTSTGQLKQQLHTGGIVVDLCSINVNQQTYLAALTSKLVKIFKWS